MARMHYRVTDAHKAALVDRLFALQKRFLHECSINPDVVLAGLQELIGRRIPFQIDLSVNGPFADFWPAARGMVVGWPGAHQYWHYAPPETEPISLWDSRRGDPGNRDFFHHPAGLLVMDAPWDSVILCTPKGRLTLAPQLQRGPRSFVMHPDGIVHHQPTTGMVRLCTPAADVVLYRRVNANITRLDACQTHVAFAEEGVRKSGKGSQRIVAVTVDGYEYTVATGAFVHFAIHPQGAVVRSGKEFGLWRRVEEPSLPLYAGESDEMNAGQDLLVTPKGIILRHGNRYIEYAPDKERRIYEGPCSHFATDSEGNAYAHTPEGLLFFPKEGHRPTVLYDNTTPFEFAPLLRSAIINEEGERLLVVTPR